MLKKGIVIFWEYSTEYLDIDFDNLESSFKQLKFTTSSWSDEDWGDGGGCQKLLVDTEFKCIKKNNQYHLTLTHSHAKNECVEYDDFYWGKSTIEISKNKLSGKVDWADSGKVCWVDDDSTNYNDTVNWERRDWKRIPSGERKKLTVTKTQREQEKFRKELLSIDKKCVITGEDTKEVLEAAHIISVADGGKELKSNGVILRSDIHKLYDANIFSISKTGKIEINSKKRKDVSKKYKDLLSGSEISSETISRIQHALSEKHALSKKSKKA